MDDGDIFETDGFFGDGSGSIEGEIQEVEAFFAAADGDGGGAGFAPADESFNFEDGFVIGLARFFVSDIGANFLFDFDGLLVIDTEESIVFGDEIGDPTRVVIEDGDVATGHVGHMDSVSIFDEADKGSAHADDIIIGVWAEAEHRFVIFAGWVVFDGIHHPAEDAMGEGMGGSVVAQELMEIMFSEVFVVEHEEGFVGFLAEPKHGLFDELFVPFNIPQEPRGGEAGEFASGGVIEENSNIAMILKIGCGYAIGDGTF